MARTKEERHNEVWERAKSEFERAYSPQSEVRLQCLEDRRFCYVPSAQWSGSLETQFENRPRFEVNKLQGSVIRIFSEYRNNRISVMFRPSDGVTNGEESDMVAGLFRSDEDASTAQEAYDNAFEEAVSGGIGAWRLVNAYEDESDADDDRQRIRIEPIYDADSSVFFNVDAKRQDKRDATRCWVLSSITKNDYNDKYGDADAREALYAAAYSSTGSSSSSPASFASVRKLTEYDWFKPDVVYLAEYYEVEEKPRSIYTMLLQATGDEQTVRDGFDKESKADAQDEIDSWEKKGYILARKRVVKSRRVHKYLMDGCGILEDYGYIAGENIPVIPVYGKRGFVDNTERIQGHIRLGKDVQRLYNMLVSTLADISAMSPREKPIFTPEQVQGHELRWAEDNTKNYPYQLVNPITDQTGNIVTAGAVDRVAPPQVPPALAALIQLCGADIQEVTGAQNAGEQIVSNVSAKAVELVQNKIDMQSFIYMDNMGKAMRRCGEVWLSMARELYDEDDRSMRTLAQDGSEGNVTMNQPGQDKIGAVTTINSLQNSKYDVRVDVGPSFSSKRDSTVRSLMGIMQFVQDPQTQSILMAYILENIDGEGLQDIRDYFRKQLVKQGVVPPTDEEKEELAQAQQEAANQPPDANTVALTAQARDFNASAEYKGAQTVQALANADKAHADAAKTLSDTHIQDLQSAMSMLQQIMAAQQQQQGAVQAATPPTPNGDVMGQAAQSGQVSAATSPFVAQ